MRAMIAAIVAMTITTGTALADDMVRLHAAGSLRAAMIVADPDTIITWDRTFYDRVRNDPLWAGITAVRAGRVYLSPTAPFGWIDRPPSVNRLIGLKWLAGLFYPDLWEGDLRSETAAYYRLWYHVDLGEAELDRLLEWANGRAP
jgi:iron complex transport system substrate-binding protein